MANPSSSLETCSRPWYLWPNILGLDAPLVAVLWCWFYAQVQGISLPHPIHLLLGGAVWSIYTIDRLLDVRYIRSVGAAWTERHRFAARFFWAFLAVLIMVTGAGLYGAGWVIPAGVLYMGVALAVAGLFYFLLVWSPRRRRIAVGLRIGLACLLGGACWFSTMSPSTKFFYGLLLVALVYLSITRTGNSPRLEPPKELVSGLVFALGCILPATFYTPGNFTGSGGRILALWSICALNCLYISWTERQIDRGGDPAALPQRAPWIGRILPLLCAGAVALCGYLYQSDSLRGALPYFGATGLSAACLLLLVLFGPLVSRTLRRVLADVALLSPLLFAW